jgi:hypothetical protein
MSLPILLADQQSACASDHLTSRHGDKLAFWKPVQVRSKVRFRPKEVDRERRREASALQGHNAG